MPSSRQPHDPFTTTATGAGLSAPSLRHQASQQSVRSNASSASARQQQRELLAPSRTRRPLSRASPRVEDDVLADTGSEHEIAVSQRQRPTQTRRLRHGSPETKHSRLKVRQQAEEQDLVNRGRDGGYFLDGIQLDMTTFTQQEEEERRQHEKFYAALARKYFTTGAHMSSRTSRHAEDEFEQDRHQMAADLQNEIFAKMEKERWLYEPVDRFNQGYP